MRQDDEYRRGRHVVHALSVHLVFVTNSIFRESCGQGPGRVGRLPSAGSVSCCRHGALAHVGDVLSQPGRTPILRGSVLQLFKDPIQLAAWPLRGQQHRQVAPAESARTKDRPPAGWMGRAST
jgi:hypothetical protein